MEGKMILIRPMNKIPIKLVWPHLAKSLDTPDTRNNLDPVRHFGSFHSGVVSSYWETNKWCLADVPLLPTSDTGRLFNDCAQEKDVGLSGAFKHPHSEQCDSGSSWRLHLHCVQWEDGEKCHGISNSIRWESLLWAALYRIRTTTFWICSASFCIFCNDSRCWHVWTLVLVTMLWWLIILWHTLSDRWFISVSSIISKVKKLTLGFESLTEKPFIDIEEPWTKMREVIVGDLISINPVRFSAYPKPSFKWCVFSDILKPQSDIIIPAYLICEITHFSLFSGWRMAFLWRTITE